MRVSSSSSTVSSTSSSSSLTSPPTLHPSLLSLSLSSQNEIIFLFFCRKKTIERSNERKREREEIHRRKQDRGMCAVVICHI